MANESSVDGGSGAGRGASAGADLAAIPVVEIETGLIVYGEIVREVETRVRGRVTKAVVIELYDGKVGATMHVAVPVTDGVGKAMAYVKQEAGWPMRRTGLYLQFGEERAAGKVRIREVTWLPVKFPLPRLEDVKAGV